MCGSSCLNGQWSALKHPCSSHLMKIQENTGELAEQLAAGKRPGNGKKARTPESDDTDPQKKLLRWEEDYRSRQKLVDNYRSALL